MSFGKIIRQLRHDRGMTQERLAEILSVSPQAISRWETDAAMPDISLIAPLCNIFGITSDSLLEIDVMNRQAKTDEYSDIFCAWASAAEKPEELRQYTIGKLREGLRLYPDCVTLKRQLSTVLWMNSEVPADIEEKKEMCRLCAELIEEESDMAEKCNRISMYCSYARFTGNAEKGKAFALMLPDSEYSRQYNLALCCENDEERKKQLFEYMVSSWGEMRYAMLQLITECVNSSDEIKTIRKKQEQINAILFDNDDVVRYADFDEFKVAKAFYRAGDYDSAVEYLGITLAKWTENHALKNVSALREKECDNVLDDSEIKANARGFIRSASIDFPELLSDERMVRLVEKARQTAV